MSIQAQILNIVAVQLLLLGYTLYAGWDPFLLFFVYVADLFLAAIIGMVLCIARGGIKFLPWALFSCTVVCGLAAGLLFAGAHALIPGFSEEQSPSVSSFVSLILAAASTSWLGIIINSSTTATRLLRKRNEDIFFLPLYPSVRIFPLFPALIIGGFIAMLGFPQAVIVAMAIAHLGTDLVLVGLRLMSGGLQKMSGVYALVKN